MGERVRSVTRGRIAALAAAAVLPLALAIPVAVQAGSSPAAGAALGPAPAPAPARTLPAGLSMWGWGTDNDGELGSGTRVPFTDTPVQVKLPAGISVTATRAGCQDTVALTSKGTAYAWGNDTFGEAGDGGTATARTKPVAVKLPKGTRLTSVRAGCDHDLALTSKGTVLAWGFNGYGQLGDGTTTSSDSPVGVHVPSGDKIKSIAEGRFNSLALTTTGTALAWGANGTGELGTGSLAPSDVPVPVDLEPGLIPTAIGSGPAAQHSLAIVPGAG